MASNLNYNSAGFLERVSVRAKLDQFNVEKFLPRHIVGAAASDNMTITIPKFLSKDDRYFDDISRAKGARYKQGTTGTFAYVDATVVDYGLDNPYDKLDYYQMRDNLGSEREADIRLFAEVQGQVRTHIEKVGADFLQTLSNYASTNRKDKSGSYWDSTGDPMTDLAEAIDANRSYGKVESNIIGMGLSAWRALQSNENVLALLPSDSVQVVSKEFVISWLNSSLSGEGSANIQDIVICDYKYTDETGTEQQLWGDNAWVLNKNNNVADASFGKTFAKEQAEALMAYWDDGEYNKHFKVSDMIVHDTIYDSAGYLIEGVLDPA